MSVNMAIKNRDMDTDQPVHISAATIFEIFQDSPYFIRGDTMQRFDANVSRSIPISGKINWWLQLLPEQGFFVKLLPHG